MRLKIGGFTRPVNEAVASISYSPIYDITRKVAMILERWDISGTIVNDPATQRHMSVELNILTRDYSQENVDLVFLEDTANVATPMALRARDCFQGPYIVDSSLPNQANDVYATGMSYRIVYEAKRRAGPGSPLLDFEESIQTDPGGQEFVMVGGAVNYAERQLGYDKKPYRYRQVGRAVGMLAYPRVPPPIWPWAVVRAEPATSVDSPRNPGLVDTDYPISWQYEFAWHAPLKGLPHRRV